MSCKNNTPNVNKTFIIEPLSLTGGTPVLSACTSMYTNLIQSCSGDTTITLGTGIVTFNSNINGIQSITATTIEATTYLSGGTNILDIINSNDTFVTGGTFNDIGDSISLVRNDGANIVITGLTNFYTTGGTYNNSTGLITFNRNDQLSAFTVDLSSIDINDTFVTGTTLSGNILTLERNDGVDLTTDLTPIVFSGGSGNCITDLYITNLYGCSPITIKDNLIASGTTNLQASSFYNLTVSGSNPNEITNVAYVTGYVQTNEIYSTGGTYNSNILTINRNDGGLFNVTITGITDTFVTAATLNSTTIELDRNEGLSTLSVDLLPVLSGKTDLTLFNTYTGNTQIILDTKVENGLNVGGANEIFSGKSGTTLIFNTISGGSNTTITQVGNIQKIDVAVPPSENTFVTGGTYNSNTDIITFNNNSGDTFNVTGITDTFVSGVTFNNGNYQLTTSRNDSTNFVTDLSILASDIKVTGGTYNINTGVVTFRNNSGGTFNVTGFTSGMTDSYTTTAKTSGTLIQFDNNLNGPNFYSVDLTPIISGKTDVTLFDSHTGDTSNPHNVTLTQLSGLSETLFNTYTGDTQIILDTKVENGLNVGGANEIFSGKSGTTLIFRTISGGSNTTITQVGDTQRIDVAVPPSENTFVTGGTYNTNTDIITFNNNSGGTFNVTGVTDTFVTGTTFTSNEGTLTRNDGSEIFKLSGGTNVTLSNPSSNQIKIDVTIPTDTNTFVTGGTYSDSTNIITLDRNDAVSLNITGLTNTYVTGGTVSISATDNTNSGTIGLFYKDSDGIPRTLPFEDTFTSGGTYNNGTKLITFDRNDGNGYNISLSSISTTNTYVTGFTYNDANTFTLERNEGEPDLTTTINSVTGFTINGDLVVTGDTNVKGLTGTSAVLSANTDTILTLIGSGATNPIFKIEGSSGELFTVTDSLLGSLFAVNNISGLAIFEVFSDDRILMGSYLAPSLNTTVRTTATSGTTNIYSIPTSAYTGAFFDYTLVGNGGARSGNIMSIWSGTTVEFNEVTTNDIGSSTNGVTFNVSVSGGNAILAVSAVTGTYTIKTIVRSI